MERDDVVKRWLKNGFQRDGRPKSPLAVHYLFAAVAMMTTPLSASPPNEVSPHPHARREATDSGQADILSLELVYTVDAWRAASGGARQGTRILDNFDILVEADLEAVVGWQGATAFIYGLYNNGRSLNELMGDAQVASNIETGVKAFRLYEAWVDQKIGDRASLRVGLYDLNSEFDALETSSLFMGSAHGIGTDISQSGENGPSIFPATSLAARVAVDVDDRWTLRAAAFDGVPGNPARPGRTAIRLGDGDGAFLIGEVERKLTHGKLIAGYWQYTAAFNRHDAKSGRGNNGAYVRAEVHLSHEQGDREQGMAGFVRLGIANGAINAFSGFVGGGLTYTGVIPGRRLDQLGIAVAAAFPSEAYRRATGFHPPEVAIELTYRAPITSFLTIQPNLQYVFNPSSDPAIRNALAIGLRTEIGLKF